MQLKISDTYSHLAPLECTLARVGGLGDGGYVIPAQDRYGIEALFSVGISDDWSFERQIAKHSPRCTIYGYDRTSGSVVFAYYFLREILSNRRIDEKLMKLKKWMLLTFAFSFFWNGSHKFYRKWIVSEKKNEKEVSITEALNKIPADKKIGIKIDIEGNEYEIGDQLVDQIRKRSSSVRFIIIEFHDVSENRDRFLSLTKKIQSIFSVAHVHANNFGGVGPDGFPEVIEITFSSCPTLSESKRLPTPNGSFDKPCNPLIDDLELVFSV
jgi:hypothetical protein